MNRIAINLFIIQCSQGGHEQIAHLKGMREVYGLPTLQYVLVFKLEFSKSCRLESVNAGTRVSKIFTSHFYYVGHAIVGWFFGAALGAGGVR